MKLHIWSIAFITTEIDWKPLHMKCQWVVLFDLSPVAVLK